MRIVILLSIVTLALSGCASSGINMYSVPTPRVCTSAQNTRSIRYEPIQVETVSCDRHVSQTRQAEQKIAPTEKNHKSSRKNFLNEAMGVSYKFFKDGIGYIKPKLSKIRGNGK